jgi:hypothetical protein
MKGLGPRISRFSPAAGLKLQKSGYFSFIFLIKQRDSALFHIEPGNRFYRRAGTVPVLAGNAIQPVSRRVDPVRKSVFCVIDKPGENLGKK